jgi:hypothetical protein
MESIINGIIKKVSQKNKQASQCIVKNIPIDGYKTKRKLISALDESKPKTKQKVIECLEEKGEEKEAKSKKTKNKKSVKGLISKAKKEIKGKRGRVNNDQRQLLLDKRIKYVETELERPLTNTELELMKPKPLTRQVSAERVKAQQLQSFQEDAYQRIIEAQEYMKLEKRNKEFNKAATTLQRAVKAYETAKKENTRMKREKELIDSTKKVEDMLKVKFTPTEKKTKKDKPIKVIKGEPEGSIVIKTNKEIADIDTKEKVKKAFTGKTNKDKGNEAKEKMKKAKDKAKAEKEKAKEKAKAEKEKEKEKAKAEKEAEKERVKAEKEAEKKAKVRPKPSKRRSNEKAKEVEKKVEKEAEESETESEENYLIYTDEETEEEEAKRLEENKVRDARYKAKEAEKKAEKEAEKKRVKEAKLKARFEKEAEKEALTEKLSAEEQQVFKTYTDLLKETFGDDFDKKTSAKNMKEAKKEMKKIEKALLASIDSDDNLSVGRIVVDKKKLALLANSLGVESTGTTAEIKERILNATPKYDSIANVPISTFKADPAPAPVADPRAAEDLTGSGFVINRGFSKVSVPYHMETRYL